MSDILILPATTYQPPSPPPVRRTVGLLNTIMEEEPEDLQRRHHEQCQRNLQVRQSSEKIVQWLTPRSAHFPTPRGCHFMSAPILPDSPSTASFDENTSSISSNQWHRASVSTDVTEFDDIYDVSDDEDSPRKMTRASSQRRRASSDAAVTTQRNRRSLASPRMLPHLIIPTRRDLDVENWSERPGFKKLISPVPPSTPAIVMSPEAMTFLQLQQSEEVPTISAPPSLDGSLSSDQMAAISAPMTPVSPSDDDAHSVDWSGVQLQPGALETLQALSGSEDVDEEYQPEQVIEVSEESIPEMAQQTRRLFTPASRPSLRIATGQHQRPLDGLTRLEVPSPSGFFSSLSPSARRSWYMPLRVPDEVVPPTSTTAEQFYRCPWREPAPHVPQMPHHDQPVEHVVEISSTMSDGMPTARPIIREQIVEVSDTPREDPVTAWLSDGMPTSRPIIREQIVEVSDTPPEGPLTAWCIQRGSPTSPNAVPEATSPYEELVATEIITMYDPEYAKKQQAVALSNLDRTELWLVAQKAYLQGVYADEEPSCLEPEQETVEVEAECVESPATQKKKAVHFSEDVLESSIPPSPIVEPSCEESPYYQAFDHFFTQTHEQDAFVHRLPRFEAIQTQRIALRKTHRNQLLGNYKLSIVPQSERKRMSANVVRGDDVIVDDPDRLRREKEVEASAQMATANWHVDAIKALNGGHLFSAPVTKRLAKLSSKGSAKDGVRILDLGGQATCDWAWHCAATYPDTKVYSVTTKAIRQLSNCNIQGPPNHRQVAAERLTRLPFPDAHFDVVSARDLHSILKFIGENGEDEWVNCLSEVMRVLKPGGHLDFSVMDSDLVNAGPLGLAKSVEFGFTLKTLGYDPNPTRLFLGRLERAGFDKVRRAWLCLPMGHLKRPAGEKPLPVLRDSQGVERFLELEGIPQGSTESAACIAGVAGGWTWERWLLRCEMEKMASESRLWLDAAEVHEAGSYLDGVHNVIEEGRSCGTAYRVLNGFARKPRKPKARQ